MACSADVIEAGWEQRADIFPFGVCAEGVNGRYRSGSEKDVGHSIVEGAIKHKVDMMPDRGKHS